MKILLTILLLTWVTMICAQDWKPPFVIEPSYMIVQGKLYHVTYVESKSIIDREDAIIHCARLNMTLPDMATAEKERAVHDGLISLGYYEYLGAFYTSGYQSMDGLWRWSNLNDKEMTYKNPEFHYERLIGSEEMRYENYMYVVFSEDSFTWFAYYESGFNFYVCQEKEKKCLQ